LNLNEKKSVLSLKQMRRMLALWGRSKLVTCRSW